MAMKSQDKVLLIRKKLFRAYEGRAEILKALAHPARLIMIETMQESGEICVNDLVEMIGCDQSASRRSSRGSRRWVPIRSRENSRKAARQ